MEATWRFERGEDFASPGGETEKTLAPVGGGALAADQAEPLEPAEDTAEISGIEAQFSCQFAGGGLIAMGEFVKDPDIG
jgi:hypothetical protein